jgi:hypothetical protein
MTSLTHCSRNKRVLILGLLVANLWFFFQDVCGLAQEVGPCSMESAAAVMEQYGCGLHQRSQAFPINIKKEKRAVSVETPSQSLKHASILLRRSAHALETNEVLAVQLIRQVISILKHQVIPSLLTPNSSLVPIGLLFDLTEQGMDGEKPMSPASETSESDQTGPMG